MVAYLATVVWYVLLSVTTVMVVSALSTLVTGLAMVSAAFLLIVCLNKTVYCNETAVTKLLFLWYSLNYCSSSGLYMLE